MRVTLWLTEVAVYTFELIFPGENKLVEFLVIFHQIHSYSISRLPWRHLKCDRGLFVMISPAESCVPFLSACIHDFAPFKPRINHILFNCCIHIIVEPARFNKMGKFHCCVIEWSNIVRDGKMPKMFRLSSQRLIRRNPHLAFYFNWNPIFVISTNLLMVR